jgi:shikimate kinase
MNRIFLVGYMGSGKSTLGKKLARKMQYSFVDLDKFIEKKFSRKISDIFSYEGEDAFRIMEREALEEVVKLDKVVISLGGGTPCFFDNITLIQKNGISVYLKMPATALLNRLQNAKLERPLLKGMRENEKMEFIQQQLGERERFYLRTHLIFNGINPNVDVLLEQIRELAKS